MNQKKAKQFRKRVGRELYGEMDAVQWAWAQEEPHFKAVSRAAKKIFSDEQRYKSQKPKLKLSRRQQRLQTNP